MASPYYTDYAERSAMQPGTIPEPILRASAKPRPGREGTYKHPRSGKPRKVVKPVGRRVKTSMLENF